MFDKNLSQTITLYNVISEGVGVVGAEVFGVFREVSERSSLTQGKHGFAP